MGCIKKKGAEGNIPLIFLASLCCLVVLCCLYVMKEKKKEYFTLGSDGTITLANTTLER